MNPSLDEINSALAQKNKNQSSIKISVKLKKLEIASKLALTKGKKNKIQGQAVELLKEVDTKIKSLALQKFVIGKVKRLQALGEKRDRINELIGTLEPNTSFFDDAKRSFLGFGIDKKFIGLSAEEVLNRVNAVPKDVTNKKTSTNTSTNKSNDASTKQKTPNTNLVHSNNRNDEPVKLSSSTGTVSEVQRNNEKIYDYLVQSGELDIADYVLDLMTAPQKNNEDPKKLSEVQKNTEEIKKLSVVNSGIREELEEIKENMVDEQDTSMDLPKKLQQKKEEEALAKGNPKKEDKKEGSSFLDSIMAFIGGTALSWFWKLLRGAKGIVEFAGTIIKSGWKAISGLLGKLFSSKFALAFAAAFKGAFDSAYKVASRAALGAIEFLKTGFSKLVDLVRKIPGIGKLIPESWGSDPKKASKPGGPAKTSDKATKSVDKPSKLSNSKLGEVDDLAKKASKEVAKDTAAKKGAKVLPKLLKFAKPIPLLGTAITAGTAIYAAYDGYENAAEITGKRPPTTEQRYIAAAANVVDDATFGMLSSKTAAAKIMEWVSSDEVKQAREKYEALGIITYNRIGDSTVNNWDELRRLSPEEIQKIIDIDDWSNKDLVELKKAKEESSARTLTKQTNDQEPSARSAQVTPSVPSTGSSTTPDSAVVPEKVPAPAVPTPTNEPKKTSQESVVAKDAKPAKISENAGKAAMVQALDKAKINDPVARAAIMAQVATESGGFRLLSENLNYRAGTLSKLWPRRFHAGDAQEVAAGGPVRVAERVYSSRMGNGPEGSGDAWNYRGRGFIQLTGKNNYQRFGYANDPEALTTPETAAESALKYMGGFRGNWGDIAAVSKYVNGGKIGLEERIKWFEAMKADPEVTVPSAPEKTPTSTNTDVPKIPSSAGTTPSVSSSASDSGVKSSASSSTKPAPTTPTTPTTAPNASASSTPSATPTKSDNVYKLSAVMKAQPGVDMNINKGFEERVAAMAAAFKQQTGKTLTATSGLRSNEKQKALWDAKLAETGSAAATRKWVAEPAPPLGNGRGSMHMSGLALDINSKGSEGINKLAGPATAPTGWLEKFGLSRPVKNEDWHVQPSDAKISTPDNPDKPGEPIAVPDKAGKAFDVATGKSDPSISAQGAQAAPTAKLHVDGAQNLDTVDPSDHPSSLSGPAPGTSTPEKTQLDMAMLDSAFIKQAKMEADARTMHAGMASLAKEYAKASGSGNREKMENIRQAIHAKQSEFRGAVSTQEATVADKSILAKDKAIQATEQTYTAALANTQSYDMKTSGASGSSNSSRSMTINNVNNQKDEKTNPFEMFDNLQEA